ncbi:adenine guanine permease [Raphidocelis subcapitata]|uniref:Adenine guanine permease n=1 Tax=Raphidocelis subcapitata TaxID=307507 RepID=A0A2V0PI84_9CHLO|nr:adenine guanine permease [Raphidocelis subcapitata]|eukprot:GBF96785.1 adenine guanine permease [Raphidocelis subcapitata]
MDQLNSASSGGDLAATVGGDAAGWDAAGWDGTRPQAFQMPPAAVPVIDLSAPDEAATVAALGRACRDSGFFIAAGHGVPQPVVDAMFDQMRRLFALPLEDKMKMLQDENNRGYTPMAEETLDPERQTRGDTKEGFYFGREVPAGSPEADLPLHGPNVWPPPALLPGFRPAAEAYFREASTLGHRLLRLLALSLGLEPAHFDRYFDPPMAFLRPLRYGPEASSPGEGVFGAGAHTDYGMLTILATDGSPGLQVRLGGAWVEVPPAPGCFVCNLGDMLERWTNGLYRSTLHRVVSTSGKERFSLPFFFEPNFSAVVEALPCCVTPDRPARHPPTTAGAHLLEKYAATHAGYQQGAEKSGAGAGGGRENGGDQSDGGGGGAEEGR